VSGLDLAVHLELLGNLPRQHLAQQNVGSAFFVAQLRRLHLELARVFRHLAVQSRDHHIPRCWCPLDFEKLVLGTSLFVHRSIVQWLEMTFLYVQAYY